MKSRILQFPFFILFFFTFACQQEKQTNQDPHQIPSSVINNPQTLSEKGDGQNNQLPIMSFSEQEHHFEKIKEGDTVQYAFKFKNTGKSDLVISTATASCGCTIPFYPKKPVKPNEEEFIKVTYNSKGRMGVFRKEINVVANTLPSDNKIYITGEVIEKKDGK